MALKRTSTADIKAALTPVKARRDTVRTINRLEGYGSSTSSEADEDLGREAKQLLDDLESEDSEAVTSVKSGQKLTWSDNEDVVPPSSILKTRKRKPGRNDSGSTKRQKAAAKDAKDATDWSDDDAQPEHLKRRRELFDEAQDAGLRVPPSFSDVEFSEDENLGLLEQKPKFFHTPSADYKDVVLPHSDGVIPASIAQWLREYQVQGASFLHELFVFQKGGILGDDMGLGKTIQVIAALTAAFGKTGDERDAKRMRRMRRTKKKRWYPRVLIVCPGSLMDNWASELERWGWWMYDFYHGPAASRKAVLEAAESGNLEIVITTYTTYRLHQGSINLINWDCIIADECHVIKDPRAEITKAMREANALCRIGLTGTAIQNDYNELWTLLNWTNPGRFGGLSVWKSVITEPLKVGQAHDATVAQLSKARTTAQKLVKNLLPGFFLRRMKSLIAHQLPTKSDRVVFCPLSTAQTKAYENIISSNIINTIKSATEPCPCGLEKKRGWCCYTHLDGVPWQSFVFPAISSLKKLSSHLALLVPRSADPEEKQDRDIKLLQGATDHWRELYESRDSIINYANPMLCGKWTILKKLLKFWHSNGDKVLVFSHSVRLLKMLQMLFRATTSYNLSYLDGSMKYEERTRTVDEFNSDPEQFVFLISTRAGGVGLNITSANKVVIVDPDWNPSHDLQAQDRAYRIGQTRPVEVFRLISAGTIEEIVYARQIYKQQQANIGYNASKERRYFKGYQTSKTEKGEIFGIANILSFQPNSVVLRDIVNKTNIAENRAGVEVGGIDMDSTQATDDDEPIPTDPPKSTPSAAADEDDDMDDIMNELAALIKDEPTDPSHSSKPTARSDPIRAILTSAGVEYTHENSEVVGTSRMEERLSRRAQEAGGLAEFIGERAFPVSRDEEQAFMGGMEAAHDDKKPRYGPPEDVRRRQFCTMARMFGYEDVVQFALVVESWTQAQRRDCLDRFYRQRKKELQGDKSAAETDTGFSETEDEL